MKAKNSAWVKAVNELSEYKVQSYVRNVPPDLTAFQYIDVFENPVHWGQVRSKMEDGALDSVDSQLNESAKCQEASLYEASESDFQQGN